MAMKQFIVNTIKIFSAAVASEGKTYFSFPFSTIACSSRLYASGQEEREKKISVTDILLVFVKCEKSRSTVPSSKLLIMISELQKKKENIRSALDER